MEGPTAGPSQKNGRAYALPWMSVAPPLFAYTFPQSCHKQTYFRIFPPWHQYTHYWIYWSLDTRMAKWCIAIGSLILLLLLWTYECNLLIDFRIIKLDQSINQSDLWVNVETSNWWWVSHILGQPLMRLQDHVIEWTVWNFSCIVAIYWHTSAKNVFHAHLQPNIYLG